MTAKARWIGDAARKGEAAPTPGATVKTQPSLEAATTIVARGMAPANAIIERIAAGYCRLRSVVLLDPHAVVEFDVNLPGQPSMTARGRITERNGSGPRFVYSIALDRTVSSEADPPRSEPSPVNATSCSADSLRHLPAPHTGARPAIRLEAEFSLQFRTAKEGFRAARAANVSTGGLLVTSDHVLVEGMVLELQFTLPSDVLEAYPERTTMRDLRNLFKRRSVPSKMRREFEEIVVQARVIHHRVLPGGVYQYGLAFLSMSRETRQEITRYVDAIRLAHIRH